MSVRAARTASLFLLLTVPAAAAGAQAPPPGAAQAATAEQASLPSAPGVEVVRAHCTSCHGVDLIVSQRLTRAGWDREVAKMERWSRSVPVPDRDRLLDYVAGQFGPTPLASVVPASTRGREIHARACLTCHDEGLTRVQRLTAAGWRRTVTKMVGWGARVPPDDVDALVAFLLTPPADAKK